MEISDFLMDYIGKDQIQDFLRAYDLKVSGNKPELIERLVGEADFNRDDIPSLLYKEELKEICDILDLPRSGNKDDLWERILDEINDLQEEREIIEVVEIPQIEETIDDVPVSINEIMYPERVISSSTSFNIGLELQNSSKATETVQIWHHAGWLEGGIKKTPLIRLRKGEKCTEDILLPTPSKDSVFAMQIRLLDSTGTQIQDQKYNLEVEVKTSGKDKILNLGKNLGKILISKL